MMSIAWKCPKCGAVLSKGGDVVGNNGLIADPVGFLQQAINGGLPNLVSTETCTNCGAKYNRDDIRKGKYDVSGEDKSIREVYRSNAESGTSTQDEEQVEDKQTYIYEVLMDAICCVMCADRKIVTRERKAVQKVMEKTKAPWTKEDTDNRINKFLARARKDGMKKIVQETCEKLPEFEKRKKKNVLLQCIDCMARADGVVHEKEIELINKFREKLRIPPVNVATHKKTGEAEKEKKIKVSSGSTSSAETSAVPTITPAATEPIEASSPGFAETIPTPKANQAGDGIAATIAVPPDKDDAEIQSEEQDVPIEWEKGQTILDLYEVKHVHRTGGMGLVYRVHHKNWNIELAVKSPRADFFKTEAQKENFIRECETWINLGLHPNIVSCYYVRRLGDIPRVFAEYVEGGSLKDWVNNKKLYEGGKEKALERILDIAIQFAWGLQYSHEKDLVHQDVKPANVMMTNEGEAKVTDFGLAKARATAGEVSSGDAQQSILVSSDGMTPAYCSPEQANKQKLSLKTDIWSWGLSVLEMFAGEVFWRAGQIASDVLESFLETGSEDEEIPEIPQSLIKTLKQCFQDKPEDRPKDMKEMAERLKQIYKENVGQEYTRPEPKPAELLADGLNNRAVSMLDLGQVEKAKELFEEAFETDPRHPEVTYNSGLLRWRSGKITDQQLIASIDALSDIGDRAKGFLAEIHIERGDRKAAKSSLGGLLENQSTWANVKKSLDSTYEQPLLWSFCLHEFREHSKKVTAVAITPNGRWGLSGVQTGNIGYRLC